MSRRKDRERALREDGYRNQVTPNTEEKVKSMAENVDVSDITKSESQLTVEEIKDCRRCYSLGKLMPIQAFRPRLEHGLSVDFKNKAKELEKLGKPHNAEAIVDYYWSEPEFQKTCALAQIGKDDIAMIAFRAVPNEGVQGQGMNLYPKPPWYKRLFGGDK